MPYLVQPHQQKAYTRGCLFNGLEGIEEVDVSIKILPKGVKSKVEIEFPVPNIIITIMELRSNSKCRDVARRVWCSGRHFKREQPKFKRVENCVDQCFHRLATSVISKLDLMPELRHLSTSHRYPIGSSEIERIVGANCKNVSEQALKTQFLTLGSSRYSRVDPAKIESIKDWASPKNTNGDSSVF
ncbi:hypothetical protein Tco_0651143 [Tanacetum coccineum]